MQTVCLAFKAQTNNFFSPSFTGFKSLNLYFGEYFYTNHAICITFHFGELNFTYWMLIVFKILYHRHFTNARILEKENILARECHLKF